MTENKDETGFFMYMGKPVDLSADEVRLDLATPLEIFLFIFVIFAGFGVFLVPVYEGPWWGSLISLGFCVGGVYAIKYTDCTYILDNRLRRLDYQRIFLGIETRYPVCRFDEIYCVAVKGSYHSSKSGSWWEYEVAIITNKGEVIPVSDGERNDVALPNKNGEFLAEHLDVDFVPAVAEQCLKVKADPRTGKVTLEHGPHEVSFRTLAFIFGFILLGFISAIVIIALGN